MTPKEITTWTVEAVREWLVAAPAFLLRCVRHVVGLRSKKEMRWIDARRVIAVMENAESIRDWSFSDGPSHSMRTFLLPVVLRFRYQAVAMMVSRSKPKPAFFHPALIDLLPESVGKVTAPCSSSGVAALEPHRLTSDMPPLSICPRSDRRGFSAATFAELHRSRIDVATDLFAGAT